MTRQQTLSLALLGAAATAVVVVGVGTVMEKRGERRLDEYIARRRVSLERRFPPRAARLH